MSKVIAFASDHAGVSLKEALLAEAEKLGFTVLDLGTNTTESVDFPIYAHKLAATILEKKADFGVMICGTGIGSSMALNRHKGVRAAVCHDVTTARVTRKDNDANVLCLGARIIGPLVAKEAFQVFIETPSEGGRHARRVGLIENP